MASTEWQNRKQQLTAARTAVLRLEQQVAEARQSERETVEWSATNKQPISKGYWQDRHDLEMKLDAARRLVQALEES